MYILFSRKEALDRFLKNVREAIKKNGYISFNAFIKFAGIPQDPLMDEFYYSKKQLKSMKFFPARGEGIFGVPGFWYLTVDFSEYIYYE